ncbi:MAG: HAD family phosphatase [Clostridiales bacterium]|jgi:HAD superfamily hydrolase (TIGR01509 family)|nr:HAD family phosphatase [Clostridiales bacterium]
MSGESLKATETLKNLRGAIFDLDGTLLDSMPIWDAAGINYLKGKGILPKKDLREKLRPLSITEAAGYLRTEYCISDDIALIIDGINKTTEDAYFFNAPLKSGIYELLKLFAERGVKMCIATATDRYLVEAALKRNGISDFFEAVLTCSELKTSKRNSADIYLKGLEVIGTNIHDTFVFEDALYAVKTAKKSGFKVVGVYDESASPYAAEVAKLSDIFIRSWHDLTKYKAFLSLSNTHYRD